VDRQYINKFNRQTKLKLMLFTLVLSFEVVNQHTCLHAIELKKYILGGIKVVLSEN